MVYKEKVFILKTFNFSEAHLIVCGLNAKGEKRSVVAYGARKSKKRFQGGILESTHFIEWLYTQKPSSEMGSLKEANLKESFSGLRKDYGRLSLGLYFLHLIDSVSLQGMSTAGEMFHLLGNSLRQAETTSYLSKLKFHFELKFLFEQGVLSTQKYKDSLLKPISEHEDIDVSEFQQREISQLLSQYLEKKFDLFPSLSEHKL